MNAQAQIQPAFDLDTHTAPDASPGECAKAAAILAVQEFLGAHVGLRTRLERLRKAAGPMTPEGRAITAILFDLEHSKPSPNLRHWRTDMQRAEAQAQGRATSAWLGQVENGNVCTIGD